MNGAVAGIARSSKLACSVLKQFSQLNRNFSPASFHHIQNSRISFRSTTVCYCTSRKEAEKVIPNVDESDGRKETDTAKNIPQSVAEKYVEFKDRTRVIQDVIEEAWDPSFPSEVEQPRKRILYERGVMGVFDVEELTDLLREERAGDVCVIKIPKEMDYADHMILVTAKSPKHMFALATFVRRRFKHKRLKATDILPRIEGTEKSEDWVALDLGNIVLHIFTQETRDLMDLETLWTVGSQYDDLTHRKDPEIVQLLRLFQ